MTPVDIKGEPAEGLLGAPTGGAGGTLAKRMNSHRVVRVAVAVALVTAAATAAACPDLPLRGHTLKRN